MITYEAAPVPVRADFAASHQRFWTRLARPGAWWTGAERVAIAREARAAASCAHCLTRREALSPHTVTGTHASVSRLPAPAIEVTHVVMTDAHRLTRRWHDARLAEGLSDGQYVELVGTIVALVSIDRFCRALGLPPHPLPDPEPGEPSGYRPVTGGPDEAWVPMVPLDNRETPEADLWPAGRTGNVIRALSLVPDEVRTLADLSAVHYLENSRVRDPSAAQGALSRPQMELLAGRVSALNQCFY
ncbi:MAG: hypothetical protein CL441_06550 [Acidimicrobiaceae bacterium]|nr:hypothetical protein [Acidimicrobiaceae bacterium]